ncbi:hypothetical protein LTR99_009555 [Exophiala xenobiotica]|uniref:Zn(2)-C6 fungal-type domain-containing protein n=1 Tax=Vermiconidia calcicola TaxID=1690605 RepID=A0AAV9Q2W6_9PEZI|nr:hypothetical protein LTR96_001655 [Exophiala xenobiotica]KAK5530740.1 hypothetical protein LTR23_010200 [Chaetothyriales sp. CCFEE 6169]KAK5533284.1 hypothetical protein LTR25_007149 [Vermiconidia calcicola]KAK5294157.1 hypothetical protein LTR99_009555 [Exophiala xenobiotica]KAK5333076.1 hypothetical protein LTR98_010818 [Exophiala xenobiotica]
MVSGNGATTTTTSTFSSSSKTLADSSSASSSSSSSSSSPTPGTLQTPKNASKPIKLRAACNQCFSAKVRCDGNKEGCRRCSEKRLSCIYSESRVGKVVGKRRKRPLPDQTANVNSHPWIVNGTACSVQSIPSPAASHESDESNKRPCTAVPNWTSFSAGGSDQGFMTFDETTETLNAIEMANNRSFSMTSEVSFFTNNGLPTPALSPPQFTRYLSPAQLDTHTRPSSKHGFGSRSVTAPIDPRRLCPPANNTTTPSPVFSIRHHAVQPPSAHQAPEDEETVCIKLLAHLKRHSSDESQPRETQLQLLKKCNAAVRRILHSKTIRSSYTCHLLLSSILGHLVRLCERLCLDMNINMNMDMGPSDDHAARSLESQFLQDQVHYEGVVPGYFENAVVHMNPQQPMQAPEQETMMTLNSEVMSFASTVADMLKRKPHGGFQTLGRHESFHAELEQRLMKASALLQS